MRSERILLYVGRYCHVLTLSAYIAPATDTKRPWYSGLLAQLTKRIAGRGVTVYQGRKVGGSIPARAWICRVWRPRGTDGLHDHAGVVMGACYIKCDYELSR